MMKVWRPTSEEINNTENWGIWKKEVSEFEWFYDVPELCYIIKGQAIVTDNSGNRIDFKAGDMVKFDKGLKCLWKITEDIEKRYNFG